MKTTCANVSLIATLAVSTTTAHADGAFGRLDGDAAVQVDVGGATEDQHEAIVGALTLRYLQTAGVYTTWLVHPEENSTRRWSASFGVELRPLFVPRFLMDLERGSPSLNLLLDSLSFRAGVVTAAGGPYSHGGPGFESGLAIGLPLFADASGPWLGASGAVRWSHTDMGESSARHRSLVWTLTVGWQEIFGSGLVEAGDETPE